MTMNSDQMTIESGHLRCPRCQNYLVGGLRLQSGLCVVCADELKKMGPLEKTVFVAPTLDPPTAVRTFASGATRDTEEDKLDYEGFINPLVLERYAQYMHKHRHLSNGTLRDSDNHQKGIPLDAYEKSLTRHFFSAWRRWRGWDDSDITEHLCGIMFNTLGMLFEVLKKSNGGVDGSARGPHKL